MAYEHAAAVGQVAGAFVRILRKLTDEVPDQQQILSLIGEAEQAIRQSIDVIGQEEQDKHKAKFIAKVFVAASNRALDILIED